MLFSRMRWPLLLPFLFVDSFALSHSTSSYDVKSIPPGLHNDESAIVRPRTVCQGGKNKHEIDTKFAPSTRTVSNGTVVCLDESEPLYARNEVHGGDSRRTSLIPSDIKDIESLVNRRNIGLSLPSSSKINQHWHNLQILKSKVDDLQRQIKEEEHEILNILTQEDQGSQLATFTVLPSSYSQYNPTYLLGICAVILLVGALFTFVSKFLLDSTHCLRRRVDRAARREERRTRRAYRIAARHLKWRKWWEGSSSQSMPNPPTDDTPGGVQQNQQSERESTLPIEPNTIQAEILSFRQTLNYVGGLIQEPALNLETSRVPLRESGYAVTELHSMRNPYGNTAPSSTAGLTSIVSPKTSTVMSLETLSSSTVDSLETIDTDPPRYHP